MPTDRDCLICRINDGAVAVPHGLLYQDDLWVVRLIEPPWGVAGWLVLQTRRHCPEPAMFTDAEAVSFGPVLRRFEAVLRDVTGAARIYTAALGEQVRHFHCHLVPRYEPPTAGALGWDVFGLAQRAAAGEITVDEREVARLADAFRNHRLVRVGGAIASRP